MYISSTTGIGSCRTIELQLNNSSSRLAPCVNSSKPKTFFRPCGATVASKIKQTDMKRGTSETLQEALKCSKGLAQCCYGNEFTTAAMDCFVWNVKVKKSMQALDRREALGLPSAGDGINLYWAKSGRDKATHLLATKMMLALNAINCRPTLDVFTLPGPFIVPALDLFAANGLVTPFGDAVCCNQPRNTFTTDHDGYLADCTSTTPIIGRWLEEFWGSNMVCEPDPFPVTSVKALARLMTADGFLEVVLSRTEAGRALLVAAASLGYEVAPPAAVDAHWEEIFAKQCFCLLGSLLLSKADVGVVVIGFCKMVMAKQAQVAAAIVAQSVGYREVCADSMAVSSTSSGGGRYGGGGALTAVGAADEDGTSSRYQPMVLAISGLGLSGSDREQYVAEEPDVWSAASPLVLLADGSNSSNYVRGNKASEAAAKSRAGWWGRLRALCGRVVGRGRRG